MHGAFQVAGADDADLAGIAPFTQVAVRAPIAMGAVIIPVIPLAAVRAFDAGMGFMGARGNHRETHGKDERQEDSRESAGKGGGLMVFCRHGYLRCRVGAPVFGGGRVEKPAAPLPVCIIGTERMACRP